MSVKFAPRSLHGKLVGLLIALLLGLGAATLVGLLIGSRLFSEEVHFQLDREVAAHIADTVQPFTDENEIATDRLKDLFMHVMVLNPSLEVYLVDREGNVLAYDAPEEVIRRREVDLAPVRDFLASADGRTVRGDDPRSDDGRKPISVHPVVADGREMGYLYVILGGQDYDSVFAALRQSYSLRYAALFFAGILAVASIVGVFLLGVLTRPLRRLRRSVAGFRTGLDETVDANERDELRALETAFTRMARRIEEQMRELESTDERRREFIAGVSHDLRTPTGAVQGYLETLIARGDRLDDEERHQYLRHALRQTQRLAALVEQLFELASLEAREGVPRPESFSLAELVQDIVVEYQAAAEKRGVLLRARFPYDLPAVQADIALIERALQNLIDNALRYTVPPGEVAVHLEPVEGGVRVLVRDDGPGIPAEALPRVFDRFFRAPRAGQEEGGESKSGAGLGLAITRRIIDLHESSIAVESDPDSGTTFSFVLGTTGAEG